MEKTKEVRSVIMLPLVMFGAAILCTNTYVYRVAQRHARQLADIQTSAFDRGLIHPDNAMSERQFFSGKGGCLYCFSFYTITCTVVDSPSYDGGFTGSK